MNTCAREECGVEYEAKTHNQKYCTSECCRLATNKRIMEKYYARQALRLGKERYCNDCGVTKLSRYNETNICGPCALRAQEESRKTLVGMFAAVSWQ